MQDDPHGFNKMSQEVLVDQIELWAGPEKVYLEDTKVGLYGCKHMAANVLTLFPKRGEVCAVLCC